MMAERMSVETMFGHVRQRSENALSGLILLVSLFSIVH
jgi:hypothetical protein